MNLTIYLEFSGGLSTLHCKLKRTVCILILTFWVIANDGVKRRGSGAWQSEKASWRRYYLACHGNYQPRFGALQLSLWLTVHQPSPGIQRASSTLAIQIAGSICLLFSQPVGPFPISPEAQMPDKTYGKPGMAVQTCHPSYSVVKFKAIQACRMSSNPAI